MDKITELILEKLPQVACGGCKFGSCADCAAAIAGGSGVDSCPACSQETVDSIASILGVPTVELKKQKAYIRCIGAKGAAEKWAKLCITDCVAAADYGCPDEGCAYGCSGIGDCIKSCKFNAIGFVDGAVAVNRELCNGCMACRNVCPKGLIDFTPFDATVYIPCSSAYDEDTLSDFCKVGCSGCGECAEQCPVGAITMVDNLPVIDYSVCAGCLACSVFCTKRVMTNELHDITPFKKRVAFVRCNGGNGLKGIYEDMGISDCKTAAEKKNIPGICDYGCSGFGECVEVCRHDALHIVNGVALVDPEKCVGCMACVETCPKKLIVEIPYKDTVLVRCASHDGRSRSDAVCEVGCLGCGDCVDNCPNDACRLEDNHAVVDCEKCESCSACRYFCTRDVIVEMKAGDVWERFAALNPKLCGVEERK